MRRVRLVLGALLVSMASIGGGFVEPSPAAAEAVPDGFCNPEVPSTCGDEAIAIGVTVSQLLAMLEDTPLAELLDGLSTGPLACRDYGDEMGEILGYDCNEDGLVGGDNLPIEGDDTWLEWLCGVLGMSNPTCAELYPPPELSGDLADWLAADPAGATGTVVHRSTEYPHVPLTAVPTSVFYVLDAGAVTGSLTAPQTIFGSEGANPTNGAQYGWTFQVGRGTGNICSRVKRTQNNSVVMSTWQCADDGNGVDPIVGMARWTSTVARTELRLGASSGLSTATCSSTACYDSVVGLDIGDLANAEHLILHATVYVGGSSPSDAQINAYLDDYQQAWGVPQPDPDQFEYPFEDAPLPEAPAAVPVPIPPSAPDPAPEIEPNAPITPAEGEEGWFDALGNRIGGMFEGLGSLIGSAFDWLGDLMSALFEWLVEQLWAMFEWLGGLIYGMLQWLGQLLGLIYSTLQDLIGMIGNLFTTLFSLLQSMFSGIMAGIGAVVDAVAQLPGYLVDIVRWIIELPGLIVTGIGDLLYDLFVPTDLTDLDFECSDIWPCNWVEELVGFLGGMGDIAGSPGGCVAPGIGWSEFMVSAPPPSGCSAAAGNVGGETGNAGDLFGWRVPVRMAGFLLFAVAFVMRVIAMTPWAEREHYRYNPEQQTLFD